MKTLFLLFALLGVSLAEIYLQDRFDTGNLDKWVKSLHKDDLGEFKLSAGKFYGDEKLDVGLQTSQDAKFYGLSRKFDKPLDSTKKPLVVQFTVKHEQSIDCGGGYVKLFDCSMDQTQMHGESPYKVMFGPDICGHSTKKVHVIFNHKEKNHLIKKDVKCKDDVYSHLYTLIVQPEGKYEVLIDNEVVESGLLEDDWDFLPPKKIKDPEASKPEDWDEREKIDDPEDSKPEDWDKPENIPDAEATKPEDWDEEMDGEWEPPMVPNPDYKGEWKPKQIDNPDYKGKWVHPMIDNPEYKAEEAKGLGTYGEICSVGFDLWQVKSGTIFDNLLITDDPAVAKKIGEETWGATKEPEKKMHEAQEEEERKKAEEEAKTATPPSEEDAEDDEDLDDDFKEEEEEEETHDEL